MSGEMLVLIVGMGLVTCIPRMLPFIVFRGKELPPFIQGVLRNVPYAALGALIFPAVLFIQEDIWYGVTGAVAAFALAFAGANIIIVVIGAIAVLSFISYLL